VKTLITAMATGAVLMAHAASYDAAPGCAAVSSAEHRDRTRFSGEVPDPKPPRQFVAAEQMSGRVVVYCDYPNREPVARWHWSAKDDPNIRREDAGLFGVPDECKERDGGRTIIMNDSLGGAAGLDVATGVCKWYVNAGGNPHSVELLPDGRVAVASSTGATLKIFDVSGHPFDPTNQVVKTVFKLVGGHGVCWDAKRNALFALGDSKLYEFDYDSASMSVKERRSWDFSKSCGDEFGHDLLPDGRGGYYFTNHTAVWHVDPDIGTFEKARDLGNVKGFSPSEDGDLVTIPIESWWTDTLLVLPSGSSDLRQARKIRLPGAKFYKARWIRRGGGK